MPGSTAGRSGGFERAEGLRRIARRGRRHRAGGASRWRRSRGCAMATSWSARSPIRPGRRSSSKIAGRGVRHRRLDEPCRHRGARVRPAGRGRHRHRDAQDQGRPADPRRWRPRHRDDPRSSREVPHVAVTFRNHGAAYGYKIVDVPENYQRCHPAPWHSRHIRRSSMMIALCLRNLRFALPSYSPTPSATSCWI